MLSYRQADIKDRLKPRFIYIFGENKDDRYITEETADAFHSDSRFHTMFYPKNDPRKPFFIRPGYVFGIGGYIDDLKMKDIYVDNEYLGKVDHIDSEGYVYIFKLDGDVVKIDPLAVGLVKRSPTEIYLVNK